VANHVFSGHRERGFDEVKEQELVIRVYDEAGNVIETHEHAGEFKEPSTIELQIKPFETEVVNESVAPIARRITEVDPRRVALGNEASLRCDNQFQIKYGLRTDEMRSCSLFRVCWIVK
jgi:hypothetical protein